MITATTSVTVLKRISVTAIKGLGANRSDNREIATGPLRNMSLTSASRTINRQFGLPIVIKHQIAATAILEDLIAGTTEFNIQNAQTDSSLQFHRVPISILTWRCCR